MFFAGFLLVTYHRWHGTSTSSPSRNCHPLTQLVGFFEPRAAHLGHHDPFFTFHAVADQTCPRAQRNSSLSWALAYVKLKHSPPLSAAISCIFTIVSEV